MQESLCEYTLKIRSCTTKIKEDFSVRTLIRRRYETIPWIGVTIDCLNARLGLGLTFASTYGNIIWGAMDASEPIGIKDMRKKAVKHRETE